MSSKPSRVQILNQIEKICVNEARQLIDQGFELQALISIVLGIEWLGGVLDNKPSGAKNQSRKRFELVLKQLPPDYWSCHIELDLYRQLRNKAVHNPWTESQYIKFTNQEDCHFLMIENMRLFSIKRVITDLDLLIQKLKKL